MLPRLHSLSRFPPACTGTIPFVTQAARQLNRALLAPALDSTSPQEAREQAILGAKQTAQYLRENVLQGVPKDDREHTYGEWLERKGRCCVFS